MCVVTSPLLVHLETHLGGVERGWKFKAVWGDGWVFAFGGAPAQDDAIVVTAALHQEVLALGAKAVRQECLLVVPRGDAEELGAKLLAAIGDMVCTRGEAIERGDVINARGSVVEGSRLTWLFATAPFFLPEGLHVCDAFSPAVVVVWLMPIAESEAAHVKLHGWQSFETLLDGADVDVTDWRRAVVV